MKLKFLKLSFGAVFLSLGITISAQNAVENSVSNGDFQTFDEGCGGCGVTQGCVPNWSSSPGSPDLHSQDQECQSPAGAEEGSCGLNHYINMWASAAANGGSEGMYQLLNLESGVNYEIRFSARQASDVENHATFVVALTHNLNPLSGVNEQGDCVGGLTLPTFDTHQEIAKEQISNASWNTFVFETGALTANYTELWIYAENTKTTNTQRIHIDNVYVKIKCFIDKYYQNTDQLPAITKAENFIIAGSEADPSSPQVGDVVVQNGQEVIFESNNQIVLKPGFYASFQLS